MSSLIHTPANGILPNREASNGDRYWFRYSPIVSGDTFKVSGQTNEYPILRQDGVTSWRIDDGPPVELMFYNNNWYLMDTLNPYAGSIEGIITQVGFEGINSSGVTLYPGMPVKPHSSGIGVDLAQANLAANTAIGVVGELITNGSTGRIVVVGVVENSDWTAITSTVTLASSASWYLSPSSPGILTATSPSASPDLIQYIGRTISSTKMLINIARPIKL